jgi:hypothetical protein
LSMKLSLSKSALEKFPNRISPSKSFRHEIVLFCDYRPCSSRIGISPPRAANPEKLSIE